MTCPPTFAAPVPSEASEAEAPSLPADVFMRLYPWASAGDACLYAAIDRCLAKRAAVSMPGIAEDALRRQWTAEPLAGDNVEAIGIDGEPNGRTAHDDRRPYDVASDILLDYAAMFEEDEESCAEVWSGHRLLLSIDAKDHRAVRFVAEYIGPTARRAPREMRPAVPCSGVARTARQMALVARIDAGLAAVPHDWVMQRDNSMADAAWSPLDDGTVDLHVRHVVAEAHRHGARYSSAPGYVTLSIHDGVGLDRKLVFSFIVRHGGVDADETNGCRGSVEPGQAVRTQECPFVQPSIGRTFSIAVPSSPRRRPQGTPWHTVHKADGARRKPSDIDARKEVAAPVERRAMPCDDRAVFASHRVPPAKRGTIEDDDHDDDDTTGHSRDIDSATRVASERRTALVRIGAPHSPSMETTTATTTAQTVADIVALYPDLTVEQAARVFAASAQLDRLPYAWVAIEAFGRGRCMATSLRASAAAMLRLKTDHGEADWYGGRRVVLALGNARDTILYRVVGEGAPEAKTQTDDDLAALYPRLSPIEMMGVGAINRALHDVPRVWVGGAGRYPHRVSLGPGGPPVTATIEAVRRLYDHAEASHMVLALGRTPAGVLTLDYGAVAPRRGSSSFP